MNYAEKAHKSLIFILIFIPLALIIIWVRGENEIKMFGCIIGLFFGYLIETKYINFKIQGSFIRRILHWMLGIIILVLIKYGLKAILPSNNLSYFLQYALICLWVIAGIPFFFMNRLQKNN
jgi:multisubunit Na+/H+ antiporter MnhE subunit